MGENSSKSLRGSGMTDLIFSGSASKASKNIALVVLTLEANKTILDDNYKKFLRDNIIEVERVNRKQRSTRIYKIDRITGDIVMTYSGSNLKSGKWYVNNNFKWIYSGNCSSMGVIKKKF